MITGKDWKGAKTAVRAYAHMLIRLGYTRQGERVFALVDRLEKAGGEYVIQYRESGSNWRDYTGVPSETVTREQFQEILERIQTKYTECEWRLVNRLKILVEEVVDDASSSV